MLTIAHGKYQFSVCAHGAIEASNKPKELLAITSHEGWGEHELKDFGG